MRRRCGGGGRGRGETEANANVGTGKWNEAHGCQCGRIEMSGNEFRIHSGAAAGLVIHLFHRFLSPIPLFGSPTG